MIFKTSTFIKTFQTTILFLYERIYNMPYSISATVFNPDYICTKMEKCSWGFSTNSMVNSYPRHLLPQINSMFNLLYFWYLPLSRLFWRKGSNSCLLFPLHSFLQSQSSSSGWISSTHISPFHCYLFSSLIHLFTHTFSFILKTVTECLVCALQGNLATGFEYE